MQTFLTHTELLALILFGIVEACCVPISSEITFGFAGVLAAQQGHLSLPVVIIVGTLAELVGSFISYAVGRKGGRPAVERYGRYVLITSRDLDRAERFFAGKGAWAVLIVRMVPVLRAFGGLVSGIVEVPLAQFSIFNAIGTVIFATVLSSIGYAVGSAWASVSKDLSLGGYVVVAVVVLALAAVILLRLREFRRERAAGTLPAELADPAEPTELAEPGEPGERPQPTGHRRTARRR
jgi:membrane protein DedA with SNARE-associated domain